jgi:hypothetical protein
VSFPEVTVAGLTIEIEFAQADLSFYVTPLGAPLKILEIGEVIARRRKHEGSKEKRGD